MADKQTILIVDDEEAIRDMVEMALDLADFHCLQACSVQQAHSLIIDHRPDLVLLDWMMPTTSGYEMLRRLRRDELTQNIPVVMLTAKADEANRVQGLDGGADDYISKPFAPRELVARIRAVLRRTSNSASDQSIEFDGLRLDPLAQRVFVNEHPISIGPTEYRLLHFLMKHPERAYSRAQILDHVWGLSVYIDERTVDVHIRRLRKSLQPSATLDRDYGRFVQTVRGTGYRFSSQLTHT